MDDSGTRKSCTDRHISTRRCLFALGKHRKYGGKTGGSKANRGSVDRRGAATNEGHSSKLDKLKRSYRPPPDSVQLAMQIANVTRPANTDCGHDKLAVLIEC